MQEIARLEAFDPDSFSLLDSRVTSSGILVATISLRLGPIETREGGLVLREREDFILCVPPDFPFERPWLRVDHSRFGGFPHVIWTKTICLYQSSVDWNPSDGLYGFFDRLRLWLGRAAINDMDPIEGPLEPPHHDTDFSQKPIVIRCNVPVDAGAHWLGLAHLQHYPNRRELVSWYDLSDEWPSSARLALGVVLPHALPMEFPTTGQEFFAELLKKGFDRDRILEVLTIAAQLTPENEPCFLVLAIPMRRSPNGKPKHHVAVWAIDADEAKSLRIATRSSSDIAEIVEIKDKIKSLLYRIFEKSQVRWCPVLEDREEIILRRDSHSHMAWYGGKRILLLGCGALGSWAAEAIVRAGPDVLHLVDLDKSIVKPGHLVRQNYQLADIGAKKVTALAEHLRAIVLNTLIEGFASDAHAYLITRAADLHFYDLIIDCTASAIFQMKLERDWLLLSGSAPAVVSLVIDANAQQCLCVALERNSGGGPWDAYMRLKSQLCQMGDHKSIIDAFYAEKEAASLFQPEPGCSDPTFSGSATDMMGLVSPVLNAISGQIGSSAVPFGIAFSAQGLHNSPRKYGFIPLRPLQEFVAGDYRVRIAENVFQEARGWARQNSRIRSSIHETGGILWGLWDEAVRVIWIFDLSGPPADSLHDPGHFVCGTEGTVKEHECRVARSHGTNGFIGFWHTHPDMPSRQSAIDVMGMTHLVSEVGHNQKKAAMLIFGRTDGAASAYLYVYESQGIQDNSEMIVVGKRKVSLRTAVV